MLEDLIEKIVRALDQYNISYMVIGGQAVLLYGEPRLTKDIDLTLGVGPNYLPTLLNLVDEIKLEILTDDPENFVNQTFVLPTRDAPSGFRIDFIFSVTSYEQQAIPRANSVKVKQTMVKFASLEDLVIHKIFSGRPRDIEDVKIVLLKNPKFDKKYIENWLNEFDNSLSGDFLKKFKSILSEIKH